MKHERGSRAPLLRLALADGRPATLLVGTSSTVLSVNDSLVSSWDLAGRPFALVRHSGTYRRGLDGGLLRKREAQGAQPRVRERLSATAGAPVVEEARIEAMAALAALDAAAADACQPPDEIARAETMEAARRLQVVTAMDEGALARDAARFLVVCGPVGILPPDQYLSVVVRVTEGCSWNECSFCSLYRQVPFRVKTPDQLARHIAALQDFFGTSIVLRPSVFLGDANALCLAQERLLPLLEHVARGFPGWPLHAFVDGWTGARKTRAQWGVLARLGLKRVYLGLETGDTALLQWLGKPGRPDDDAVELVRSLRAAGIATGVIVLLGAGGRRYEAQHVRRTSEVLARMELRRSDLLYFSEFLEQPDLPYARLSAGVEDLQPLDSGSCGRQRQAILEGLGATGRGLQIASYDLREFVY